MARFRVRFSFALLLTVGCSSGSSDGGSAGDSTDSTESGESGESGDGDGDCGTALVEFQNMTLSLSSEGNVYVQASFDLHIDNSMGDKPMCASVTGVAALFGHDGEDALVLDVGGETEFVVPAGEVVTEPIGASKFEDLPPTLWDDHCVPETAGALEIITENTQMPYVKSVPLPIGCACC